MLQQLKVYSKSRKYWIALLGTIIGLELISLYLQHIYLLPPCILCIYQRCALFGIGIAGIIAVIAPSITFLRLLAILIWIYSAWQGLWFAKKYITIQLYPSPFLTCDLFLQFPYWLPLHKWWPYLFNAYSNCSEYKWYFLSLELSQWMFIIFMSYLLTGLLIFTAQFNK